MRLAVDAEQADGGRHRRLRLPRRRSLKRRQRLERALVADLAERQRRIVLQRAVELRDRRQRVDRVLRLVVAERLDDGAAEEVFAAADFAHEHLRARACRRRRPASAASARTSDGRTNSPCSLSSAARNCGISAGSGLCSKKLYATVRSRSFGLASDSRIESFVRGSLNPVSSTSARYRT